MVRSLVVVGIAVVVSIGPVLYGQSYDLSLTSASGSAGDAVVIGVLFDNNGSAVQGLSLGVCHDPADLDLGTVVSGAYLVALNPDFNTINTLLNGWTAGMVVSFLGTASIPPGVGYELYDATYTILAGSGNPSTDLCFCNSLGSPMVMTSVIVSGSPVPLTTSCGTVTFGAPVPEFRRGEFNNDGSFDVSDAISLLAQLFSMGTPGDCQDAADVNDDGAIDIGDPVLMLDNLFGSGAPIPPPGPMTCGPDPTPDGLDCASSSCP